MLQAFPASLPNRDQHGRPKDVYYGGHLRMRISSQNLKRHHRLDFESGLAERAIRSRRWPQRLANSLINDYGWDAEAAEAAWSHVSEALKGKLVATGGTRDDSEKERKTASLVFLPEQALYSLAELCDRYRDTIAASDVTETRSAPILDRKKVNRIFLSSNIVVDMFGRMLTEVPDAGIDGSLGVAHAFSTHAAEPQLDSFTAVDDWETLADGAANTATAYMQASELATGTFYRYATVNITDLIANTARDNKLTDTPADRDTLKEALTTLLACIIEYNPQAKKNSTAPHTLPNLVYMTVREGRPFSAAAAFEKPIVNRGTSGYMEPSKEALNTHIRRLKNFTKQRGDLFNGYASFDETTHEDLGTQYKAFDDAIAEAVAVALDNNGDQR